MPIRAALCILAPAMMLTMLPACGLMDDEGALACQQPPEGNWQIGDRELPPVIGMNPVQAAAAFDRIDLAVSWRYSYATEPSGETGYSECWCVAPPDGTVNDAFVTETGWVVVMVSRDAPILGGRPQPRVGWGCEASSSLVLPANAVLHVRAGES